MIEPNNIILIADDNRPERLFYADIVTSVLGRGHIYEALNDKQALGLATARKEYCLGCVIGRLISIEGNEEIGKELNLTDKLNEIGLKYHAIAMISPAEELLKEAKARGIRTYLAINVGSKGQQVINRKGLIDFLTGYTQSLTKSPTFSKAA